jgi:hypothetical protein
LDRSSAYYVQNIIRAFQYLILRILCTVQQRGLCVCSVGFCMVGVLGKFVMQVRLVAKLVLSWDVLRGTISTQLQYVEVVVRVAGVIVLRVTTVKE